MSYRENEHYAKQICVHLIRLIMTIPKIYKLLMVGHSEKSYGQKSEKSVPTRKFLKGTEIKMVIQGESKTVLIFQIGRFVKKIFKIKVGGISLDTLYIAK